MLLAESLLGSSSAAAPTFVEDVFSTYLYTGNGATKAISNGIQLGNGATTAGWISTSVDDLYSDKYKYIYNVKLDTSGNIYIVGAYSKSVTYLNLFVAKLNSSGVVQWQRSIGNTGAAQGYGLAIDSSGNVYVCGTTAVIATGSNAFLVKYNSSGTLQWQRTLGNNGGQIAYGVAVDSSGNVYICGDGGIITADYYFLTAKYNSSGTLQWQRKIAAGTSGNTIYANAIAVDSSGNVYVTGQETVSGSTLNAITVKYNTSGALQWQKRLSTGRGCAGRGIAVDSTGSNVYVVGYSDNVTTGNDTMVVKYNSSGTLQWQRRAYNGASSSADYLSGVVLDSSDNVYVVGQTGTSLISMALMKYNSSGTLQFQKSLGDNTADTYAYGITTNSTDSLFIGGYKRDTTTLIFSQVLAKVAIDGTANGGYGDYTYSTPSFTDVAGSLTDSTSTLTESANSLTASTGSATDDAGITSYAFDTIPSGTGYGGLVWLKGRSGTTDHALYDTARGATFDLASNTTAAQTTQATGLTSFNVNGFSIGALAKINTNAATYASWTFRKQPKFFDVVTYTGNGANGTAYNIAHNLTSKPGFVIIKRTNSTGNWAALARVDANNSSLLFLNTTDSGNANTWIRDRTTTTTFDVGTSSFVATNYNINGATYVAYLFAHDAGGFGATGADNVISCGSFISSNVNNVDVSLGYEPQFILWKTTTTADSWKIADCIRGMPIGSGLSNSAAQLFPNSASQEFSQIGVAPTATGFTWYANGAVSPSDTYIYIAIRRGPMRTPTTGTSVFYPLTQTGNATNTNVGFPADWTPVKIRNGVGSWLVYDRLRGINNAINFNATTAESSVTQIINSWSMNGMTFGSSIGVSDQIYVPTFRRAPGFFDEVCYTGTGATGTQSHNLGVAPELMIVKQRAGTAFGDWFTYSSALGATKYLSLQSTAAAATSSGAWNNTAPTSSVFTTGTFISISASTFVAYLFATVAGVSKVGSYTGTGTTQQINCGFTAGARFVLIKRTDSTGDWYVWDSARGIVAGNDPYLLLNSTAAEVTSTDYIDTYSAGFEISSTAPAAINANGGSFIFLAIA